MVAGEETLRHLGPVVRHMIVGLLDEPRPVVLVCPEGSEPAHLPTPPVQVLPYRFSRLPFSHERVFADLATSLAQAGAGLLHALDTDALPLARRLSDATQLPYVVGVYSLPRDLHVHDQRCRMLLAASEPIRRMLVNARAAPAENIRLFRPGVYPARMATCFTEPQHSVAIVAAGELQHFVPWSAVIDAFAGLTQRQQDCAFFIIGTGRAEAALRRQAEKLHLMTGLTFVEQQAPERLTDILRSADLFVAPDLSDRVDIELLSAMASGTPVLACDGGNLDFINEQTAVIFPRGQAAELEAKLAAMMSDRAAARRLAENALAHLRQEHSPAAMVQQLVDAYRSVCPARSTPSPSRPAT